jgi:hypothetical protein
MRVKARRVKVTVERETSRRLTTRVPARTQRNARRRSDVEASTNPALAVPFARSVLGGPSAVSFGMTAGAEWLRLRPAAPE